MDVCARVRLCVCWRERARESARDSGSVGVSAYVSIREEGERESVDVCVRARMCVCVGERLRARVRK